MEILMDYLLKQAPVVVFMAIILRVIWKKLWEEISSMKQVLEEKEAYIRKSDLESLATLKDNINVLVGLKANQEHILSNVNLLEKSMLARIEKMESRILTHYERKL